MSDKQRGSEAVERDIFRRLDPGGELGEMLRAFEPLIGSLLGRAILRVLNVDLNEAQRLLSEPNELIHSMTEAIAVFAPANWAPSSQVPVEPYRSALTLYRRTHDLAAAEATLVEAWNEPRRLRILLRSLIGIGANHEPLQEKFRLRWRLIDKALRHHEAGAYEASVPIVLAQIDGIVWDLAEGQAGFFSGNPSFLVDEVTIAGLPEGLNVLRKLTNRGL